MSTSDSTVKGKFDEAAGKVKQTVGEAFGSQKTANEGAAQEVKGHGEQAWGSVKEAAHDTGQRNQVNAQVEGHDVRDKVTSTAENVKEKIQHGADSFKNDRS